VPAITPAYLQANQIAAAGPSGALLTAPPSSPPTRRPTERTRCAPPAEMADALFRELEQTFARKDDAKVEDVVTSIKIALLDVNENPQAALLGQRALEYAVLAAARRCDKPAFQRHVAQLKASYADPQLATQSQKRRMILGLHLLFLVCEHRLAEFHSELELLSKTDLDCAEVQFSAQLERALVVGTYERVLAARNSTPDAEAYGPFMELLVDTVRQTIAECAAAAYESLSITAFAKMLMLSSDADLRAFAQASHPEWVLAEGRVVFAAPVTAKSERVPAIRLVKENLAYATELERIV